jgi:hypothetical protein
MDSNPEEDVEDKVCKNDDLFAFSKFNSKQ